MISATFVVRNEEARLRDTLTKIRPHVDEIVVVDQSSTDRTPAIARRLADVFVTHPNYGFCEPSRMASIEACHGEWILVLDADEEITPDFARFIKGDTALGWPTADCYELARETIIGNDRHELEWHLRFFRAGSVSHSPAIHSSPGALAGRTIKRFPAIAILHHKTWVEQHADDARYQSLPRG